MAKGYPTLNRAITVTRPSWLGGREIFIGASVVAWFIWVLVAALFSPYELKTASQYFLSPLALLIGAATGWGLRRVWQRTEFFLLLIVVLLVTATVIPIYANASAAVGGLMIAFAGLAALDTRDAWKRASNARQFDPRTSPVELRILGQAIVLVMMATVAIWLVLDSQAAIVLAILVAVVIVMAWWIPSAPPPWVAVGSGFFLAVLAGLAVLWLGNRSSWPSWLAASESLSSARHTLWSDALRLWAIEPVFGAGPGAFTPSSQLASEIPSLASVHSLLLQVGSELGAVGVVLLVAVFVAGLFLAAHGERRVAFVAIAAWTALAIHASMDHLEDFPIVAFMAGIILGWSGLRAHSPGSFNQQPVNRRNAM